MTTEAHLSDEELLRRLVAFDSTSRRSNLPIADFLCDYLDRPGVRIERQASPQGDKTNLVVTAGPEVEAGDRPGLTLSGHLDVVPAEEPEWRSDPFELTVTDEKLIGRGACDMKGFVALAANGLATAERAGLRRPLALLLTYDEEVGTLGARHFVDTWPEDRPLPRRTIVGEPTSLAAVRMHKGFCTQRVTIRGESAHSGYPHLGRSAIEPVGRAITALATLRRELESEPCPNAEHFPEVPYVALNVGLVRGGAAVNVVPDRCRIWLGFRVLPGMGSRPVAERVRAAVAEALAGEDFDVEELDEAPPFLLAEDHDLHRGLCRLLGQDRTVSASYATDAGWLQRGGFDCLLWGPGSIAVAHRPNEFMPRAEYRRGGELLKRVVDRFCGRT
jgi:acetylornithine deacetylase